MGEGKSEGVEAWGDRARAWADRYAGTRPLLACVFGCTATGLLPGISAAGATPADRRTTALADGEFLALGRRPEPVYPLPPLVAGASPVLISRAIVTALDLPLFLFDAGLEPELVASWPVQAIPLGGTPAACVSTGRALAHTTVERLFAAGLAWGDRLAAELPANGYAILGECVVGGTTTALAVLLGLGFRAAGKVNSSHPTCNHAAKLAIAQAGLLKSGLGTWNSSESAFDPREDLDPLAVVAAVGDPMQAAVAGMAIALSRSRGVLLAGGTQMLAVYALARALATRRGLAWQPAAIAIGTTGWVAHDASGDTAGLVAALEVAGDVPALLVARLNFAASSWGSLRAYEAGFVKEGVAAGGCAIAAALAAGWGAAAVLAAVEELAEQLGPRPAAEVLG